MAISKVLEDTLLSSNSLKALSETSGADKDQVQQVLTNALPTIIRSMQKNASTADGEKALSKALSDHAKNDTSNLSSFLKNVDIDDGTKILTHILGNDKKTVETRIADKSGLNSNTISTILATAAPLLLNLIGKKKDEDGKDSGGILGTLASALLGSSDNKKDDDNSLGDTLVSGLGSLLGGKDDGKKDDNVLGDLLSNGLGSLLGGSDDKKKSAAKKKPAAKKKSAAKKTAAKKKPVAKRPASSKKK